MDLPLSAADLRADVALLRQAFETLHPGLYRYRTRAEMARLLEELERELGQNQTRASVYLRLSVFLAKIRCGHTYANFYNQRKEVTEEILMRGGRLPFHFRWLGGRMVVTRDLSATTSLEAGTEILAIDGVSVRTILRELLRIARADGGNDAKRIAYLEVQGRERFEAFDIYLPLLFPAKREGSFTLRVRRPGTRGEAMVEVEAWTQAQRIGKYAADQKDAVRSDGRGVPWTLRYEGAGGSAAVLDMPTWALFDNEKVWQSYLHTVFDELIRRRTSHLLIDLRANEGGAGVGNVLLSRLIDRDLNLPSYRRYVRSRAVPAGLNPYLETWDRSFRDWGAFCTGSPISAEAARRIDPALEGLYRMTRFDDGPDGDVIRPAGRPFVGRVSVLVGANNSSATFEFAQAIQASGRGALVGQPTGGSLRGINGGAFFFLQLPGSGIEVDLPLVGLFPTERKPDRGLLPDVRVTPRVEDIVRRVDAEADAALRRSS